MSLFKKLVSRLAVWIIGVIGGYKLRLGEAVT